MIYDVLVIGAGPCGISASNYCNRLGLKTLLLYEKFGGQINYCKTVHSIPSAPNIKVERLLKNYKKTILKNQKINEKVYKLTKINNLFHAFTKNRIYISKTVIVCSGANPKIQHIKGIDENMILTYKNFPYNNINKNDNILIIGGGYIGLEISHEIYNKVSNIYIIEKSSKLGGNSKRRKFINESENIHIFFNSTVSEMKNNNIIIKKNDKYIIIEKKITKIFFAMGIRPEISFINIKNLIKTEKGISINREGEKFNINMSNIEGLFAAGDVVDIPINGFISMAEGMGIETAKAVFSYINKQNN